MEKKFKEVQPCGMLYSHGREYFLLRPSPEKSMQSWETWRWLVVPNKMVGVLPYDVSNSYYSYKRHIVTNSFTVEFMAGLPKITILVADEYDLSEMEA